jgi:hypothetical protein
MKKTDAKMMILDIVNFKEKFKKTKNTFGKKGYMRY